MDANCCVCWGTKAMSWKVEQNSRKVEHWLVRKLWTVRLCLWKRRLNPLRTIKGSVIFQISWTVHKGNSQHRQFISPSYTKLCMSPHHYNGIRSFKGLGQLTRSVALDTLPQLVSLSFEDFLIYHTSLTVPGLKDCLHLERTIYQAVLA